MSQFYLLRDHLSIKKEDFHQVMFLAKEAQWQLQIFKYHQYLLNLSPRINKNMNKLLK
jgi:hypothetical protein